MMAASQTSNALVPKTKEEISLRLRYGVADYHLKIFFAILLERIENIIGLYHRANVKLYTAAERCTMVYYL